MPNIFQDIGRTNALSQGTGDILNTAIGLRRLASQEANEALNRESAELNIASSKLDLAEKKKQAELLDEPIRAKDFFKDTPPSVAEYLTGVGRDSDLFYDVGGVTFTTRRKMKQGQELLEQRLDILGMALDLGSGEISNQMDGITEQLLKEKKPENSQALIQQRDILSKRLTDIVKQRNRYDAEIRRALALRTPDTGIGDVGPDDFTPESIELFKRTGNYSALVQRDGGSFNPPTSYQEWVLAGRPGTYADWLKDKNIKSPTMAQQTVAEYAARIEQSTPIIQKLENHIQGMSVASFSAQIKLPAAFQSDEIQQYMQAARNFINAKLRRESGAVISDTEFSEARQQYLPQPGDSSEVLKQKADTRMLVYSALRNVAGNAYQSVEELIGGVGATGVEVEGLKILGITKRK